MSQRRKQTATPVPSGDGPKSEPVKEQKLDHIDILLSYVGAWSTARDRQSQYEETNPLVKHFVQDIDKEFPLLQGCLCGGKRIREEPPAPAGESIGTLAERLMRKKDDEVSSEGHAGDTHEETVQARAVEQASYSRTK